MEVHRRTNYDPSWIVELARSQRPSDKALHNALECCTMAVKYCECGCGSPYFREPDSSDWQHADDVVLEDDKGTPVIVEIQRDGKVGHIEIGVWHEAPEDSRDNVKGDHL